eukprot:m.342892 g.342892  ORF g.342892 m.342892 type:complete len:99 (+) comp21991_c0_seq1:148-444(+)
MRGYASLIGWGSVMTALFSGMYLANVDRRSREEEQFARGSRVRSMTFEEKIMKAEWEEEQRRLAKEGKDVHPYFLKQLEDERNRKAKVGVPQGQLGSV